jgi:hypothetical protein
MDGNKAVTGAFFVCVGPISLPLARVETPDVILADAAKLACAQAGGRGVLKSSLP